MRIRKTALILLLTLALSVMFLQASFAAQDKIDTEHSATLTLKYDTKVKSAFSNVSFSLYRVADISPDVEFTLTKDFADYSKSFKGLNNDGWTKRAEELSEYVKDHPKLKPIDTSSTSSEGVVTFPTKKASPLKPGLYLVIGGKKTIGNNIYTAVPVLYSLPSWDQDKETKEYKWQYDVNVKEAKLEIDEKTGNGGTGNGGGGPRPSTVQRTAVKVWKDDGNEKMRPDSIVAQLLRNGNVVYAEVTLDESNNWQYTWTGLDSSYDWTITEKSVPDGYTVSVKQNGTTFTITNTYKGDDDPDGSKDPTDPDDPNRSKDPTDPDDPNRSKDPTDPNDPNNSDNSNDPNEPDNSDNSNDPNDPDNRTESDNPNEPGGPDGTSELVEEPTPTLPQTGMLWWPVPVMYTMGTGMFFAGYRSRRKNNEVDENDNEEAE